MKNEETKKEVVQIMLSNPYFEDEIEILESFEDVKTQLEHYNRGDIEFLTVTKRSSNRVMVDNATLINPKNFARVEISKYMITGF